MTGMNFQTRSRACFKVCRIIVNEFYNTLY
ncbi:MAG: hypothetical protein E7B11_25220 [Clostridiales bacterium]|nr:hypothetical protein [Clostridiales bacterium]